MFNVLHTSPFLKNLVDYEYELPFIYTLLTVPAIIIKQNTDPEFYRLHTFTIWSILGEVFL